MTASLFLSQTLSDCSTLTSIIGERYWPVIIPDDKFEAPCIDYTTTSSNPQYVKSGYVYDVATVEIYIYTKTYAQGVQIAQIIRDYVEHKTINKQQITVNDQNENYDIVKKCYLQILELQVKFSYLDA